MNAFSQMVGQLTTMPISDREFEVSSAYNQGDSHQEIADSLGISVKTVEVYASNTIKKMRAKNLRHACYILRTKGIL
jgi:DNA-binding NarL/FixJ family response regulator